MEAAKAAAKAKAREQAIKKLEEEIPPQAPMQLKIFFPCCGVVGTLQKMSFLMPKDLAEKANPLLEQLKD